MEHVHVAAGYTGWMWNSISQQWERYGICIECKEDFTEVSSNSKENKPEN